MMPKLCFGAIPPDYRAVGVYTDAQAHTPGSTIALVQADIPGR